jgi:hypothetical protein
MLRRFQRLGRRCGLRGIRSRGGNCNSHPYPRRQKSLEKAFNFPIAVAFARFLLGHVIENAVSQWSHI